MGLRVCDSCECRDLRSMGLEWWGAWGVGVWGYGVKGMCRGVRDVGI